MTEMGIQEVRETWSQTLEQVRGGERLTITFRGKPVAVMIPKPIWERIVADLGTPRDVQDTATEAGRVALRELCQSAKNKARHTWISLWGDTLAVVAPVEWYQKWDESSTPQTQLS